LAIGGCGGAHGKTSSAELVKKLSQKKTTTEEANLLKKTVAEHLEKWSFRGSGGAHPLGNVSGGEKGKKGCKKKSEIPSERDLGEKGKLGQHRQNSKQVCRFRSGREELKRVPIALRRKGLVSLGSLRSISCLCQVTNEWRKNRRVLGWEWPGGRGERGILSLGGRGIHEKD